MFLYIKELLLFNLYLKNIYLFKYLCSVVNNNVINLSILMKKSCKLTFLLVVLLQLLL